MKTAAVLTGTTIPVPSPGTTAGPMAAALISALTGAPATGVTAMPPGEAVAAGRTSHPSCGRARNGQTCFHTHVRRPAARAFRLTGSGRAAAACDLADAHEIKDMGKGAEPLPLRFARRPIPPPAAARHLRASPAGSAGGLFRRSVTKIFFRARKNFSFPAFFFAGQGPAGIFPPWALRG